MRVQQKSVRMVAVNTTSLAMTTHEIGRAFVEDEELTKVHHWKTGDCTAAPSSYRLLGDEITVV